MRFRILLCLVVLAPAVTVSLVGQGATGAAALEAARRVEVVDGDLAEAARRYQSIAAQFKTSDPATAALALLRVGGVYAKQGDRPKALEAYRQVLAEPTVAADVAARANAMVASLQPASAAASQADTAAGDRVVWAGGEFIEGGRVSRDGRFVVHTDWETGRLVMQDLLNQTTRALVADTSYRPVQEASLEAVFSPDGRRVAYGWYSPAALRVLDVDASETTFEVLYANPDLSGLRPADWSTDGRWIAAVAQRARTHEVAIIGAHDGSYRALKTVGWRGPGAMFFSPDGRYLAYDVPSDESALQHDVFVTAVDGSSEAQLAHAATERIMGWSPDGRQLLFTSDRNTTVGLWSQPMTEGKPVGQAVLLKPDVGTITSLGTGPSGELFAVKDASTLSLHVAPVDFEKGELAGPPVIESVRSQFPRWSPDGRQLGYSFTAANGQKAIVLKTVDGGRREIRPDVVGYLRGPEWLPDGQTLVVYGRDPQGRAGLFEVDIATGRTTLFALAGIIIDAVLSADGKSVYQLERGPSAELPYKLVAHDLATGAIRDLGDLSRDDRGAGRNMSPDDRWVARTRLIDGKWTVSVSPFPKGTRRVVHTFERQHDDEELWFGNWMADGSSVVVFRRVPGMAGRETWVVPIDGRAPRRMNIDMSEWTARYESIQFDPHGRYLTFSTGDVKQEIVRIDSRLQR